MKELVKPADPIAAADAAVTEAQAVVAELITQRREIAAKELALKAERKSVAYKAHARKDPKSQKLLAGIHADLTILGSELASLDEALDEGRKRLAAAQKSHRLEVEQQRAQEALDRLETLLQHAHGADAALRQYVEAITSVDRAAQAVCTIAGRPSRDVVILGLRRSLYSALTAYTLKRIFEVPLLPPSERQPLAHWAESWAVSIRGMLAQRLSEPEPKDNGEEIAA